MRFLYQQDKEEKREGLGASGAPVFSFSDGALRIISMVSVKAVMRDKKVALGVVLEAPLERLRVALGRNRDQRNSGQRRDIGAKLIKP